MLVETNLATPSESCHRIFLSDSFQRRVESFVNKGKSCSPPNKWGGGIFLGGWGQLALSECFETSFSLKGVYSPPLGGELAFQWSPVC